MYYCRRDEDAPNESVKKWSRAILDATTLQPFRLAIEDFTSISSCSLNRHAQAAGTFSYHGGDDSMNLGHHDYLANPYLEPSNISFSLGGSIRATSYWFCCQCTYKSTRTGLQCSNAQ